MGYETDGIMANIGLEQEIFLVPRHAFYRRPDLQFTGRTVMGKEAARGQEMSDHYMAPISRATTVGLYKFANAVDPQRPKAPGFNPWHEARCTRHAKCTGKTPCQPSNL